METKQCHSCCEDIKPKAKQCPYCQCYQSNYQKLIRSPTVGVIIGISVVWVFFGWMIGERIESNAIYNPHESLVVKDTRIQFQDASCGKQVVVLGKITNKSESPLTDIVFDVEFYDEAGKLIDALSDTEYDLVIPSGSIKSFKIVGKSGANEALYSSHKISVAKAEPDVW